MIEMMYTGTGMVGTVCCSLVSGLYLVVDVLGYSYHRRDLSIFSCMRGSHTHIHTTRGGRGTKISNAILAR